MSYYSHRRKRLGFLNSLLVFCACIICLWAAALALQYVYQDSLQEYSIYHDKEINPYIEMFYPIPTRVKTIYIDKDFKKKSKEVYIIELQNGAKIQASNIMLTESTIAYKNNGGLAVSIQKSEVVSITKKKL